MNNYKINFETRTIKVTKAFADNILVQGSEERALIMNLKEIIPDLRIVKKTHRTTKANRYKGLTYAKMERFIKLYSNSDEILKEFYAVVEYREFTRNRYATVLKWFRLQFPDYGKDPVFVDGKLYIKPVPHTIVENKTNLDVADHNDLAA